MMKLLRVPHVARILDVPQSRVYDLVRRGILPGVRLGRQVRISEEALQQFIASGGRSLPGGWRREPRERGGAA